MAFRVSVQGDGRVTADFETAVPAAVQRRVAGAITRGGAMLETRIKANASGRPGPNAPTGQYRRSWTTRHTRAGGAFAAEVGTNAVQARRLEYGFHGTDALGRVYNQPPYPHVGPAIAELSPALVRLLEQAVVDL